MFLLFHRRGHPSLRQCTSDSAACDALVHAPTHRLVVISACPRYNAVNPARLYALFVRVHTFLQQVDSLRNATAETGDLHDFYNILHNNRLSGPSGTCGGRAFRPFFRRKIFFSKKNRKQLFINILNFWGGGFLQKKFIEFCTT